jgi:hypothetical protein
MRVSSIAGRDEEDLSKTRQMMIAALVPSETVKPVRKGKLVDAMRTLLADTSTSHYKLRRQVPVRFARARAFWLSARSRIATA